MGNSVIHSVNSNVDNLFTKKLQIVMLGLDSSGKTTLLYRMKLKHNMPSEHQPQPTTAFNVETIRPYDTTDNVSITNTSNIKYNKNLKFVIWDTAGHDDVRPLWRAYVRKSDAMIFVIDSSDSARFDEARTELDSILCSTESHGIPLLILANKQDAPGAVTSLEMARKLDLDSLKDSVNWHLHPTSGRCGEGVQDALVQLADMIAKHRKSLTSANVSSGRARSSSLTRKTKNSNSNSNNPHNNNVHGISRFEKIEASQFV